MKYLLPGTQSEARLELLLSRTSIKSEAIKEGLMWHLVKGHQIETAAALAEIKPANLHRAIGVVENLAAMVEQIKELDRFERPIDGGPDNVEVNCQE